MSDTAVLSLLLPRLVSCSPLYPPTDSHQLGVLIPACSLPAAQLFWLLIALQTIFCLCSSFDFLEQRQLQTPPHSAVIALVITASVFHLTQVQDLEQGMMLQHIQPNPLIL